MSSIGSVDEMLAPTPLPVPPPARPLPMTPSGSVGSNAGSSAAIATTVSPIRRPA